MAGQKGTSRRKRDALTPKHCEIPGCGYARIIQRHRILPGRDGGKYLLGNVVALCPTHHAEADRGWIPAEELSEIVRVRIEDGEQENGESGATEGTGGSPLIGDRAPEAPAEGVGDSAPDAADGEPERLAGT